MTKQQETAPIEASWDSVPRYSGRDLPEMIARLESLRDRRQDLVVPTKAITMEGDGSLTFPTSDGMKSVRPTRSAAVQVANRCGIPVRYFDRMSALPHLRSANVNGWLQHQGNTNRLVRCLTNGSDPSTCRAFLSDRYRIIDTHDVALRSVRAAIEALDAHGLPKPVIFGFDLSESRFDLLMMAPFVVANAADGEATDVITHADFIPPELKGPHAFLRPVAPRDQGGGRYVCPMVRIRNSETGDGGFSVRSGILDAACINRAVLGTDFGAIHLGSVLKAETILTAETIQRENEVLYMKAMDAVRSAFDLTLFAENVDALKGLRQIESMDAVVAVGHIIEASPLTDAIKDQLLAAYQREVSPVADTAFDAYNAVTAVRRDTESIAVGDELDKIATSILERGKFLEVVRRP